MLSTIEATQEQIWINASPEELRQYLRIMAKELAQKDQDHNELTQARHENTQLRQENQQLRAYQKTANQIATNTNMTYADRILWIVTLKVHPTEMLECKPFQPNVSRLRQESGVSSDSATKFLASMQEAKAIKYTTKSQQNGEADWSSVSTIIPLPDHAQANTRAATLRIKQRIETTKRRTARKLLIHPCENCGSDNINEAYAAIIPLCKSCNHVTMNQQQTILAKDIRIIEETTTPPTPGHEFSEVTDHEWEDDNDPSHEFSDTQANDPTEIQVDNSTETNDISPSHEFSDIQANDPIEIQGDNSTETNGTSPSHEFSEGMRVDTPAGLGTISLISCIHNQMRCGVILTAKQPDGSHYAVFSLNEVVPVIQSLLVEEGR